MRRTGRPPRGDDAQHDGDLIGGVRHAAAHLADEGRDDRRVLPHLIAPHARASSVPAVATRSHSTNGEAAAEPWGRAPAQLARRRGRRRGRYHLHGGLGVEPVGGEARRRGSGHRPGRRRRVVTWFPAHTFPVLPDAAEQVPAQLDLALFHAAPIANVDEDVAQRKRVAVARRSTRLTRQEAGDIAGRVREHLGSVATDFPPGPATVGLLRRRTAGVGVERSTLHTRNAVARRSMGTSARSPSKRCGVP